MRPVNLIPPEERRGDRAPARTGVLPYLIVAALGLVLAGVTAVVLTENQISDRKAEVGTLEAREAAASARADALRPYAEFASVQLARQATVTSLAQSRFDWERVMREFALVIPSDVWLVKLTGTASPEVQVDDSAGVSIREQVSGPALAIVGCAASQQGVARFVEALRDIDGVTRVGLAKSERPDRSQESGATSSGGQVEDDCRTRDFITKFELVAAFDEVPTPAAATAPPPVPAAPPSGDSATVASAQQQEQAARESIGEQTEKARDATNLIPGTVP